jgi:hypothetical protein
MFWKAILEPLKSYFFRRKIGSETGSGNFWKLDPDLIEKSESDLMISFESTTLLISDIRKIYRILFNPPDTGKGYVHFYNVRYQELPAAVRYRMFSSIGKPGALK